MAPGFNFTSLPQDNTCSQYWQCHQHWESSFDAPPWSEAQLWALILSLDRPYYPQTKECMPFLNKNERNWHFLQGYTHKLLSRILASMQGDQGKKSLSRPWRLYGGGERERPGNDSKHVKRIHDALLRYEKYYSLTYPVGKDLRKMNRLDILLNDPEHCLMTE